MAAVSAIRVTPMAAGGSAGVCWPTGGSGSMISSSAVLVRVGAVDDRDGEPGVGVVPVAGEAQRNVVAARRAEIGGHGEVDADRCVPVVGGDGAAQLPVAAAAVDRGGERGTVIDDLCRAGQPGCGASRGGLALSVAFQRGGRHVACGGGAHSAVHGAGDRRHHPVGRHAGARHDSLEPYEQRLRAVIVVSCGAVHQRAGQAHLERRRAARAAVQRDLIERVAAAHRGDRQRELVVVDDSARKAEPALVAAFAVFETAVGDIAVAEVVTDPERAVTGMHVVVVRGGHGERAQLLIVVSRRPRHRRRSDRHPGPFDHPGGDGDRLAGPRHDVVADRVGRRRALGDGEAVLVGAVRADLRIPAAQPRGDHHLDVGQRHPSVGRRQGHVVHAVGAAARLRRRGACRGAAPRGVHDDLAPALVKRRVQLRGVPGPVRGVEAETDRRRAAEIGDIAFGGGGLDRLGLHLAAPPAGALLIPVRVQLHTGLLLEPVRAADGDRRVPLRVYPFGRHLHRQQPAHPLVKHISVISPHRARLRRPITHPQIVRAAQQNARSIRRRRRDVSGLRAGQLMAHIDAHHRRRTLLHEHRRSAAAGARLARRHRHIRRRPHPEHRRHPIHRPDTRRGIAVGSDPLVEPADTDMAPGLHTRRAQRIRGVPGAIGTGPGPDPLRMRTRMRNHGARSVTPRLALPPLRPEPGVPRRHPQPAQPIHRHIAVMLHTRVHAQMLTRIHLRRRPQNLEMPRERHNRRMRAARMAPRRRRPNERVIHTDIAARRIAAVRCHEQQPELITRLDTIRVQRPVMRHIDNPHRRRLHLEHRRHPIKRAGPRRGLRSVPDRVAARARRPRVGRQRTVRRAQTTPVRRRRASAVVSARERESSRGRAGRRRARGVAAIPRPPVLPRVSPERRIARSHPAAVQPIHRHIRVIGAARMHPQMLEREHRPRRPQRPELRRMLADRVVRAAGMVPRRGRLHERVVIGDVSAGRVACVLSHEQQPEPAARTHPVRLEIPLERHLHHPDPRRHVEHIHHKMFRHRRRVRRHHRIRAAAHIRRRQRIELRVRTQRHLYRLRARLDRAVGCRGEHQPGVLRAVVGELDHTRSGVIFHARVRRRRVQSDRPVRRGPAVHHYRHRDRLAVHQNARQRHREVHT